MNDYKFNVRFIRLAALGFFILLVSIVYQTFRFEKLSDDFKNDNDYYRKFILCHHNLIVKQNIANLFDSSLELIPTDIIKRWFPSFGTEFLNIYKIGELLPHIENCKDALGDTNFKDILKKIGPLPNVDDGLPAFSPTINTLTLRSYYQMDLKLNKLKDKLETSRYIFFIFYIIGSVLIGIGGFRRKKGIISRTSLIGWGGLSILLIAGIIQNFLYAKWENNKNYIEEIRYRSNTLSLIGDLSIQTRLMLAKERLERNNIDDFLTNKEKEIYQYLFFSFKHINKMLYYNMNSDIQAELREFYNSLQMYPKGIFADIGGDEFAFLCTTLHVAGNSILNEEVKKLKKYQLISKFVLIALVSIGTALLLYTQVRAFREEKKKKM